jgi:hypothetical protein
MKRIALAIGAGIVATGAVVASAASLGTLNVANLGTGTEAITTCNGSGITVRWNEPALPAYDPGVSNLASYTTTDGSANGPDTCAGATIIATVSDVNGAALKESAPVQLNGTGDGALDFGTGFNSRTAEQITVTVYNQT